MRIRSLLVVVVIAIAVLCSGGAANAQAVDNSALIAQLQAQIASLLAQIQALQAQQGGTASTAWCHTFNTNLGFAQSGSSDVGALHTVLDKEGFSYASDTGNIYNEGTSHAVIQFQAKYGILQSGYIGPLTRAKLNSLYGCSITPSCSTLYWLDSNNTTCYTQKQFCGAYMYQGLRTFTTQQACLASAQPSITVTSPNGGEAYPLGGWMQISFNARNVPVGTSYEVDLVGTNNNEWIIVNGQTVLSGDGTQGLRFGIPSAGTVNSFPVGNYKIRVSYGTGNTIVQDLSDNYFSIVAPVACLNGSGPLLPGQSYCNTTQSSITVTSPNGGENWQVGSTYTIRYSASNIPVWDSISIYLQKGYDAGSTKTGVNSSLLIGQTSNLGSFIYTVPTTITSWPGVGSNYTIKICNTSSCATTDTSDNYFSIAARGTNPSGTLNISLDASTPIAQTLTPGQTNVVFAKIKLSTNVNVNNLNSIQIGSDSVNAYSYFSNIKIYDGNTQIANTNGLLYGGTYWVSTSPSQILFQANTTKILTLVADVNSSAPVGSLRLGIVNLNIDYAGSSTTGIISGVPAYGNNMAIISNTTQPSITVTSPNGGETWKVGETHNITWTSSNFGSMGVSINLLKPGATGAEYLRNIALNLPNTGTYQWTIPSSVSSGTYNLMLVSSGGVAVQDYSNNYFTITAATTRINGACGSANGVGVASAPSSNLCSAGTASAVGFTYNTNSWTWACLGSNGGTISGNCTAPIACTESNWTSVLSPSACPSLGLQTKTWTKVGTCSGGISYSTSETVSCNYQAPTCTNFTYSSWSACSSSGTQTRTVTASSPSACVGGNPIRSQACVYTIQPSITITSPIGGEQWVPGSTHNITWTSTGIDLVAINFLRSSTGTVAGTVTSMPVSASSGSYSWTIPSTLVNGSDYYLQFIGRNGSGATGTNVANKSTNLFTIATPVSITVTSPTGTSPVTIKSTQNITWTTTGAKASYVSIKFYGQAGNFLGNITTQTANDGSYSWTIPVTVTNGTYRIRVSEYSNATVYGESSNLVFAIPVISPVSPVAGSNFAKGSTQNIAWTTSGIDMVPYVRLDLYSAGTFVNNITLKTANTGSYSWAVPTAFAIGSQYIIKISSFTDGVIRADTGSFSIGALSLPFTTTTPCLNSSGPLLPGQTYCPTSMGNSLSQSSLASISAALVKIMAEIQAMLNK